MKFALHLLLWVVAPFAQAFAAPVPPAPKTKPNVILITVDTVRADHVGCYGAKDVETPTLDALARDGIVFEHAIAQVPLTWPSHAVILTGLYPFQNRVQDFTGQPLEPRFRSVAQAFKQQGYATAAVVSAFVLDRSWGLARGFDFYDDAFAPEAFVNRDLGLVDRRAGESVTRALAWLKKNPRRPFFFWLHLYDPHSPYDPPEPYRSQYRGHLYDGEIAYADHELARLITWLKVHKLYNSSLIAFLSDHGESLGEHGEHEHGFFLYDATVHVPLIVKPPAGSRIRPTRISRPVETAAVAPTLIRLANIRDSIEKQFQSKGLFGNAETEDESYSETFYPFSSFGWSPLHALETSRYHYIDAPTPELYDLNNDPEEKNNVAAQQTATVAVLKEKLKTRLQSHPYTPSQGSSSSQLSPEALDKLRALGYVAYRSPVSADALAAGLADPKNKLWEFNTILKAQDALQRHDDDQAEALLRDVQEKNPDIYVIPFMLGESAVRHEKWQRAAEHLQRCLELNPNFDNAMTGLARALSKLGRVDEAKSWLHKAVQSNPENYRAWYEIGLLDAATDQSAALSAYQKATAIQPNFFPAQRELGLALFNQKDYAGAAVHLEKTIALGLDDAHIHNFLGICYSQMHQPRKSIDSYQAALELDPNLAEAHLNLAFELRRIGALSRAHSEYATACQLEKKFCAAVPK